MWKSPAIAKVLVYSDSAATRAPPAQISYSVRATAVPQYCSARIIRGRSEQTDWYRMYALETLLVRYAIRGKEKSMQCGYIIHPSAALQKVAT